MKICSKCKKRKSDKYFNASYNLDPKKWASRRCKSCVHEANAKAWVKYGRAYYQRSWRKTNPEKNKKYQQKQYRKHRDKRVAEARAYRLKHPELIKEQDRKSRMKLKVEVINAYGGKCSCCGEDELIFLTIEHINHDGKKHRDRTGAGKGMYRDLKRRGFPKNGFTVFCWNCQMATRYGDPCPHKLYEQAKAKSAGIKQVVAGN